MPHYQGWRRGERLPLERRGVGAERAEDYRTEYNTVRPHEAIAWNRPQEVHIGPADPAIPTFETRENLPTT